LILIIRQSDISFIKIKTENLNDELTARMPFIFLSFEMDVYKISILISDNNIANNKNVNLNEQNKGLKQISYCLHYWPKTKKTFR
jgi:hypothetical protein